MPSPVRWPVIPWLRSPEQAERRQGKRPEEAGLLGVFSALWAFATIFHVASYDNHWGRGAVPVLAALWLLARPASPLRLVLLASAQLYVVATYSPYISNHWLFTGFVNLTLVLAYSQRVLAERTLVVDRETFFRTFAPAVRMELIVLYFFVVLHKLNSGFYSPDISCGAKFYVAQAERFPFLPRSLALEIASIHLTVLLEAAIPLLLMFRRTRSAGVLLGAVFHGLIALNPESTFYNFSSMLYALFVLFAPAHLTALVTRAVDESPALARWRELVTPAAGRRARTPMIVGALMAGVAVLYLLRSLDRQGFDVALLLWVFYSLGLIATLLAALSLRESSHVSPSGAAASASSASADDTQGIFRLPWRGLVALPVLVLLNGFAPYFGLKTETSFAMFSNLRTEGGETNHFFIPASWQVFDFQRDLVEIVSSSDPALDARARLGRLMTLFELRDYVSRRPETSLDFILKGELLQVPRAGADPLLSQPISPLLRKVLNFRDVDKSGRQSCRH